MPSEDDLDKMTKALTGHYRFSALDGDFKTKARVMELAIMAQRNNILRYK